MPMLRWFSLFAFACCAGPDAFASDPGLPPLPMRDAGRASRPAPVVREEPVAEERPVDEPEDAAIDPVEEDAALPPPAIAGSALRAGCRSYDERGEQSCAGFYCGVSEQELERALRSTVCPSMHARLLCDGELGRSVNRCARQVVSSHLLTPLAQLHDELVACIGEGVPEFGEFPADCQACTLAGIECGSERCAIACAAGDGPGCDSCRIEQGCNGEGYDCAELPNPL